MRYLVIVLMSLFFVGCAGNVDVPQYDKLKVEKVSFSNNGYVKTKYNVKTITTVDGKKTQSTMEYTITPRNKKVWHDMLIDIPNISKWKLFVRGISEECGKHIKIYKNNIEIRDAYGNINPKSKELSEQMYPIINNYLANINNFYLCNQMYVGEKVSLYNINKKIFSNLSLALKKHNMKFKGFKNILIAYRGLVHFNKKRLAYFSGKGMIDIYQNEKRVATAVISFKSLVNPYTAMAERASINFFIISDQEEKKHMDFSMEIEANEIE